MHAVLAFLALSFPGEGGPVAPPIPQIMYEFRLIDVEGLDWRANAPSRLNTVKREGGVTVWTTTKADFDQLGIKVFKSIMAPKVTAFENAAAHVTTKTIRHFLKEPSPSPDGAKVTSFEGLVSDFKPIREGVALSVIGRKLDQGILARFVIEETRVQAIHHVDADDDASLSVPEVSNGQIAGEWLIPNDGVLLVSLGAYTVADKEGKAVVRESLLVLEARPVAGDTRQRPDLGLTPRPIQGVLTGTINLAPVPVRNALPTPNLPSRTMPMGVTVDGKLVGLPPLPEVAPPTRIQGTSEPCSTPQADRNDAATSRVTFLSESADSKNPAAVGLTARRFSINLPSGQVTVEIRATTKATGGDSAPEPPAHP